MNDAAALEDKARARDALYGEPEFLVVWAIARYRAEDIVAAKELAMEAGCDFEDVLMKVLG